MALNFTRSGEAILFHMFKYHSHVNSYFKNKSFKFRNNTSIQLVNLILRTDRRY